MRPTAEFLQSACTLNVNAEIPGRLIRETSGLLVIKGEEEKKMSRSILLTKVGLIKKKKKVGLHSGLHCTKHFNLNHSTIVHQAIPPQVSSTPLSPQSVVEEKGEKNHTFSKLTFCAILFTTRPFVPLKGFNSNVCYVCFFHWVNSLPGLKMKQFNHGKLPAYREYQRPPWVQAKAARWLPDPPAAFGRVLHTPFVCLKTLNSRYIDRFLLISSRFPTDALHRPSVLPPPLLKPLLPPPHVLLTGGTGFKLRGTWWKNIFARGSIRPHPQLLFLLFLSA